MATSRDLPPYLIKKIMWWQFLRDSVANSECQYPQQFRTHCRKWRVLEICVDLLPFLTWMTTSPKGLAIAPPTWRVGYETPMPLPRRFCGGVSL